MRDDLGLEVSLADLALHHLEVNYSVSRMKQTQDGLVTILKGEEERYDEMLRKVPSGQDCDKGYSSRFWRIAR